MKKLLRYLVNTILFILLWGIQSTIVIGFSFAEVGARPSAPIAIGGIVAIIISYRLVKRINKSNLWSRLFDEVETANDVVEEKKVEVVKEKTNKKVEVEKEGSYNWKLISIVALILVAILVIFNIFFLPVVTNEQYVAEEIEDVIEQDITEETEDVILIDSRELFSADAYLARALTNREKSFHSGNSDEDLIFYYQSTINDINNAIKINPNNSSYYFYRAQTYWGYLNHAYRRLNNKLLEKECRQYALSDFSIAIRLYKNTKDKVHISDIYAGRGWLKKEMGVSYCEDFREACKNNPYTGLDNHCNVYNKQCK